MLSIFKTKGNAEAYIIQAILHWVRNNHFIYKLVAQFCCCGEPAECVNFSINRWFWKLFYILGTNVNSRVCFSEKSTTVVFLHGLSVLAMVCSCMRLLAPAVRADKLTCVTTKTCLHSQGKCY